MKRLFLQLGNYLPPGDVRDSYFSQIADIAWASQDGHNASGGTRKAQDKIYQALVVLRWAVCASNGLVEADYADLHQNIVVRKIYDGLRREPTLVTIEDPAQTFALCWS